MVCNDAARYVDAISKQFENPVTVQTAYSAGQPSGLYCVGGAFLRYHASIWRRLYNWWTEYEYDNELSFPFADSVAKQLMRLNPELPSYVAAQFGRSILRFNDAGAFATAWSVLEAGLCYPFSERLRRDYVAIEDSGREDTGAICRVRETDS